MQKAISLLLALFAITNHLANGFVLDSIDMDNSTFEQFSSPDERSDRAGSEIVADALREYMTQNQIKILLDQSDVRVQQRFPDEGIHTGHSCSKTARTMGTVAKAWMIPSTAQLAPAGVTYDDINKMAFAANDIDHQVQVDMSIRVEFGAKIFGKCKRVGRKTCGGIKGTSRGQNHVIAMMQASNTLTECIQNREHLVFNVNVHVTNTAEDKTYAPVTANDQKCNYWFGKLKVTEYANRYFKRNKFRELRGAKLVKELETKLGAKMGSVVTIPIATSGEPRMC